VGRKVGAVRSATVKLTKQRTAKVRVKMVPSAIFADRMPVNTELRWRLSNQR